jgi:hypothetical protein
MLLPDVIEMATGVDMTSRAVDAALGNPIAPTSMQPVRQLMSSYGLNSLRGGVFAGVDFTEEARSRVVETRLFVQQGSRIRQFEGSHGILGVTILRHESMDQMLALMEDIDRHIQVNVE